MSNEQQSAIEEIKKLSVFERISVVEDIWNSIVDSNVNYPVPDEQKKELELRLREHTNNSDNTKSWQEVKKNIQSKL